MIFEQFRFRCRFAVPALLAVWLMAVMPLMPAHGASLMVELCAADGKVRTVAIPVDRGDGDDDRPDCASPCHAFLSRKPAKENGSHK